MTAYTIKHYAYGFLAVAATPQAAIAYLIRDKWLLKTFDDKTQEYVPVERKFGSNWKDVVLNMSQTEFNRCFEGFYISEENLETNENY